MKILRDNKQFCAAILRDLSKAFDCIPYDILIVKLNAYAFNQEALKLIHNIANYVDDTSPDECVPYYDKIKENLELTIYKIFNWFKYIHFKANATKCQFLSSYQSAIMNIDGSIIKISNSQKLLGVTIDINFAFEEHINSLC